MNYVPMIGEKVYLLHQGEILSTVVDVHSEKGTVRLHVTGDGSSHHPAWMGLHWFQLSQIKPRR